MAQKYNKAFGIPGSIGTDSPEPSDPRYVVELLTDLTTPEDLNDPTKLNYIYEGIFVYVLQNKGTYQWNGEDRTDINNWIDQTTKNKNDITAVMGSVGQLSFPTVGFATAYYNTVSTDPKPDNNTLVYITEEESYYKWLDSEATRVQFVKSVALDLTPTPASTNGLQSGGAKTYIDQADALKVNISDIKDNLTSTDTNKPLSAKQGKVLDEKIKQPTIDYIAFSNYTTEDKNLIDVSDINKTYVVFDITSGRLENYKDGTWSAISDEEALALKADITYVDDEVNPLKNQISGIIEQEQDATISITYPNVGYVGTDGVYNPLSGFVSTDMLPISVLSSFTNIRLTYTSNNNVNPVSYYSSADEADYISEQGINDTSGQTETITISKPPTATHFRLSFIDSATITFIGDKFTLKIDLDDTVIEGSDKPVKGGGIFTAIETAKTEAISESETYTDEQIANLDLTTDDFKELTLDLSLEYPLSISNNYISTSGILTSTGPDTSFKSSDFLPIDTLGRDIYINYKSRLNVQPISYYSSANEADYISGQGISNVTGTVDDLKLVYPVSATHFRLSCQIDQALLFAYEKRNVLKKWKLENQLNIPTKELNADVIVIPTLGQSNNMGQDAYPAITTQCKYQNNLLGINYKPLIETNLGYSDNFIVESSMSGLGEFLVSEMLQRNDYLDTKVLVYKTGSGGQAISQFIKGATYYDLLIERITEITEYYENRGQSVVVPCVPYKQGEADIFVPPATSWKTTLAQIQVDLNTDIKAITGQTQDVYICLYNLSWSEDNLATKQTFAWNGFQIVKDMYELVRDNDKFICSTPTYVTDYSVINPIHLSNVGQKKIGVYEGISINKLMLGNVDLAKGLFVETVTISTNDITLQLSDTGYDLEIDEDYVSAVDNYGFNVINTSDSDIIVSVSVNTTTKVITISCSESPTGAKLRYGANGTTATGFTTGNRGNIRDEQGYYINRTILNSPFQFHNWLQMFEYQL